VIRITVGVMNLPEEFALLAYDDDGTPVTDSTHLSNGLGGALLLELALAGKVDVENKKVVVLDRTPTGDPLVDAALSRIAEDGKPRKPGHWVTKFAKDARTRVMENLVAQGVVRREQDKVLLVFPRTRYPAAHGVQPVPETEARQRMTAAVTGAGPVESRTAALCALVAATDLDKKVFRDLDRKQVKARLKEIGQGAWAATAVKKSIEEIQAAIMVAVTASSTAATTGSS
jgi:Golgi phosphoprotein 3 (GPP34)